MSTMKIKKGDTVKVIAGKDKDKEGKVVAVDKKNGKVTVEKVNIITKHTKPSAANQNGGIIQMEAPIDASNVMYLHNGKATRIGFKVEDGKIRLPFSTIPGLGESAAISLAESGKVNTYLSIEEMQAKTKVSKSIIESLKNIGALEGLPESSQMSLF